VNVASERRVNVRGPDFICIGMEKAGTGWLYDQIDHADGAWMSPIKELNHFCGDPFTPSNLRRLEDVKRRPGLGPRTRAFIRAFEEGRRRGNDASWYRDLFAIKGDRVSGDVSPNYAMASGNEIAAAVRECPTARYVLLLRHPVRRLWSALCMRARKRQWRRPISRTGRGSPRSSKRRKRRTLVPDAIWARWSAAVPRDAIGYWFLEDIAREPARVRDEILSFVDCAVPVSIAPDYNRKGRPVEAGHMPGDVRLRLYERFADEIRGSAVVFGGEAKAWLRDLETLRDRGSRSTKTDALLRVRATRSASAHVVGELGVLHELAAPEWPGIADAEDRIVRKYFAHRSLAAGRVDRHHWTQIAEAPAQLSASSCASWRDGLGGQRCLAHLGLQRDSASTFCTKLFSSLIM
jgi:hypothetical protein